jgi:SAM-dependent methyltransferase
MNRYIFDNAVMVETGMRFSGLEASFDSSTIQYLIGTGVTEGWACWEVGAGSGSIARWLAERVGPTGSVLATDIDLRFIPSSELGQLEVARHDVTTDPVPRDRYDLIHARLVMSHLPSRRDVMAHLAEALRPGGWLVIEDFCHAFEHGSQPPDDDTGYREVQTALGRFIARANDNRSDFAASLPQFLVGLGLADVGGEGRLVFGRGGSPVARVAEAGLRQVGDQMIAAGDVDGTALDQVVTFLTMPASVVSLPLMISAWGQRN